MLQFFLMPQMTEDGLPRGRHWGQGLPGCGNLRVSRFGIFLESLQEVKPKVLSCFPSQTPV